MTLLDHAESSRWGSPHLVHRHAVLSALGVGTDPADAVAAMARAAAAATTARVAFVLTRDDGGHLSPFGPAIAGGRVVVDVPDVTLLADDPGLPQHAAASGSVVLDAGPARPATTWGALCSALAVGTGLAGPLVHEGETIGVLVIADPEDLATAHQALDSILPDAAVVMAVALRLDEARRLTTAATERAALSADVVATVSHELRTPLTSIVGSLQTLRRPELQPKQPEARELVEAALTNTHRLRVLVDDLLVVSGLERSTTPMRARPIDFATIVRETIAIVPDAADRATVVGPDAPVRGLLDGDHLGRIIRNLLENAIRHAPDSQIEISISDDHATTRVAVIDHGPGVDPDAVDTLFERSGSSTSVEGLGIGLAIARGLAEAMGGAIDYEPTPDGGSTFILRIPNGGLEGAAADPAVV